MWYPNDDDILDQLGFALTMPGEPPLSLLETTFFDEKTQFEKSRRWDIQKIHTGVYAVGKGLI